MVAILRQTCGQLTLVTDRSMDHLAAEWLASLVGAIDIIFQNDAPLPQLCGISHAVALRR